MAAPKFFKDAYEKAKKKKGKCTTSQDQSPEAKAARAASRAKRKK